MVRNKNAAPEHAPGGARDVVLHEGADAELHVRALTIALEEITPRVHVDARAEEHHLGDGERLGDAQGILTQYEGVIGDLEGVILAVRNGLPTWVRWLRLGLSLALVWLGISQIALITQGWEIIGRSRKRQAVEAEA